MGLQLGLATWGRLDWYASLTLFLCSLSPALGLQWGGSQSPVQRASGVLCCVPPFAPGWRQEPHLSPGSPPRAWPSPLFCTAPFQLPSSFRSQQAWRAPGSGSAHHCRFLLRFQTSEARLGAQASKACLLFFLCFLDHGCTEQRWRPRLNRL